MALITLIAVPDMPLIQPGDDLAAILLDALTEAGLAFEAGDIVALASKVFSKAEGRSVRLTDVSPSAEAMEVARACEKDPRLVQLILDESTGVSRTRPGLLITRHRLGYVCANAGVDRSNVEQDGTGGETVLLLPADPDGSAEAMRQRLQEAAGVPLAVVLVDSHGRPHRMGTVGIAIGAAGLPALEDWRGRNDLFGRPLQHTSVGLADLVASAATLLFGQAGEGMPAVLVRGVPFEPRDGQAAELVRPLELDLYQ